jgi:hypothetical protein
VDQCSKCRAELLQLRRASATYAAVPLVPVPLFLGERIMEGMSAATTAAATGGGLSKLIALLVAKSKAVTGTALVTGSLAATTLVTPLVTPVDHAATAPVSLAIQDVPASGAPAETRLTPTGVQQKDEGTSAQTADSSGNTRRVRTAPSSTGLAGEDAEAMVGNVTAAANGPVDAVLEATGAGLAQLVLTHLADAVLPAPASHQAPIELPPVLAPLELPVVVPPPLPTALPSIVPPVVLPPLVPVEPTALPPILPPVVVPEPEETLPQLPSLLP